MGRALDGLRQIVDAARPSNMSLLRDAGVLQPRSSLALALTMPWLVGRGPSLGVISRVNSLAFGDKPAIYDRTGVLTWGEFDARSNRAANMLSEIGLSGGDRVALVLRNGREMAEMLIGAQKIGVIACPLNTWAKTKELRATIEQSRARVLVYDTAHSDQVADAVPESVGLLSVGPDPIAGSSAYEEALGHASASPPFPFARNAGSPSVIIHTSGTTGTPKGASRSTSRTGLGTLASLLTVVPYRRDDVVFCPAPMFHSFGFATFAIAVGLGATMVLPEKFDPAGSLAAIEAHRATAASFVPVMVRRIVSLDPEVRSRYDLSTLRIVMTSGSVMSEDLRRGATEVFGNVLYDLYGSTEIAWVSIATPEDIARHPRTVGKPVRGIEVAVFSPAGERLPRGQTGELFVKSDMVFEGYTSGDTKDQREGYMSIGDLGRLDAEDYLFVESRADDMVIVGGENVYPIEVEQAIEAIPGVEEVAVIGAPDPEYGHVLVAFVAGSVTEREVIDSCRASLASYKVPKRVEMMDELPRTTTGKVLKRDLSGRANPSNRR